jgi:hypothetical protein
MHASASLLLAVAIAVAVSMPAAVVSESPVPSQSSSNGTFDVHRKYSCLFTSKDVGIQDLVAIKKACGETCCNQLTMLSVS